MTFNEFCAKRDCGSCEFAYVESYSECARIFELNKNKFKNKVDQDQMAMLIADWEHGELINCTCDCENCPLNDELPIKLVGYNKVTICNMLIEMSYKLNEVQND